MSDGGRILENLVHPGKRLVRIKFSWIIKFFRNWSRVLI